MREAKLHDDAVPVAREIHRRATLLGIGQKALAIRAGLNDTFARDLYKAISKAPQADNLEKIAVVLGCTLNDLLHPERQDNSHDSERYAKTDEELSLLKAWREGGDRMRLELVATVERVAMGALARRLKR